MVRRQSQHVGPEWPLLVGRAHAERCRFGPPLKSTRKEGVIPATISIQAPAGSTQTDRVVRLPPFDAELSLGRWWKKRAESATAASTP
jgi:hypothetical protein